MKKTLISVGLALMLAVGATAQVMQDTGIQNVLWTGFGGPFTGSAKFFGFVDCLQARVDIAKFTLEGMLNWGILTRFDHSDDFDGMTFANTPQNPLSIHYYMKETREGVQNWQDPYYVNFLWSPIKSLNVGVGTNLNWQVGPAPKHGGWLWEKDAHVRQGGFWTNFDDRGGKEKYHVTKPGEGDVVGFVHYANKYAKSAIGIRFNYQGDFGIQVGGAIPDGIDTDDFRMNLGFAIQPIKMLNIAVAYEGLFANGGDLYAGVTLAFKPVTLDVYFAWDDVDFDDSKGMAYSIGAGVGIDIKKIRLLIRPEASLNWFGNSDFTPAWYVGSIFDWGITDKMRLSAWISFAIGSKDKTWDDTAGREDWIGGRIFDIRPEFAVNLTKNHELAAYVDIENRVSYLDESHTAWTVGVYWSYKLMTGKMSIAQKNK